jgi:hypothetical protein
MKKKSKSGLRKDLMRKGKNMKKIIHTPTSKSSGESSRMSSPKHGNLSKTMYGAYKATKKIIERANGT